MEQATTIPTITIPKSKRVYSIIAVCALVSASALSVGLYSGFFDDINSKATAHENIIAPMSDDESTEMPSLDEIMNY